MSFWEIFLIACCFNTILCSCDCWGAS